MGYRRRNGIYPDGPNENRATNDLKQDKPTTALDNPNTDRKQERF